MANSQLTDAFSCPELLLAVSLRLIGSFTGGPSYILGVLTWEQNVDRFSDSRSQFSCFSDLWAYSSVIS